MDVESLPATSPEMAALLTEMGTAYDPERLSQALQNRRAEVSARAIRVTATLGAFLARLAKVGGQVVCIFSLLPLYYTQVLQSPPAAVSVSASRVMVMLKASCEADGGQAVASLRPSVLHPGAATCQSISHKSGGHAWGFWLSVSDTSLPAQVGLSVTIKVSTSSRPQLLFEGAPCSLIGPWSKG